MVAYRRNFVIGGTYFFTVNLYNRKASYLTQYVDELRHAFHECRERYPFQIDAIVILPEHLHCIFTLPLDDADYSSRWKLIKTLFTKMLIKKGVSLSKDKHGQYNLWQRRFWEHTIRDQNDFNRHVEYIHFNPIKHDYVEALSEWPYSSFHRFVKLSNVPAEWASELKFDDAEFGERHEI